MIQVGLVEVCTQELSSGSKKLELATFTLIGAMVDSTQNKKNQLIQSLPL